MKLMGGMLVAAVLGLASTMPVSAAPMSIGDINLAPQSKVGLAQYYARRCSDWRRACADLYGWRTRRWHQCMHQPKALRACRGGYY